MIPYARRLLADKLNDRRDGVKTFWWRRVGFAHDRPNFGDELTARLVPEISEISCTWAHPKRSEFIGAGSILEMVQAAGAPRGLKVWGSGFIQEPKRKRKYDFPDFDFYAVRGKLTLDRVRADRRVALGDPGLLVSRVYQPAPVVPGRVGFVYNHEHRNDRILRALAQAGRVATIDPLRDPRDVIVDITKCEFVFATSLHGLVVADAFGVPNAWVALKKPLGGGRYKFEDYYSAFDGNAVQHNAAIVEDADAIQQLKDEYTGVPNLRVLQDELLAAFPYSPGQQDAIESAPGRAGRVDGSAPTGI
ncbi:hypothetical protein GKZ92_17930 [Gordonia sp. 135]|uniref:polysaccharide pyruvyl transferase family protein n=1 Tax=Gordonia sp. 135 TaxID=2676309 RepID=UPI0012BB432A|nr:polysaccharide pyruvyl transferase family protein [Gordonia sp. 135]QGP89345.1 hypothetical protein GKZ92_17930 [Gordonia sp. 135]